MAIHKLSESVIMVGALDHDLPLFDQLMPLPQGTSYNAYVVKGSEKVALIDTVEPRKTQELLSNLEEAGVERIDYVVSNHAEQDHSGTIPAILERNKECRVVCNEKCAGMLRKALGIADERFLIIKEGEQLSLGGKTLRFLMTPWVHWPETMSTFLEEERIIFTCDLFGAHLAYDEQPFVYGKEQVELAAKRYYAEIMMPFSKMARKHAQTIKTLGVTTIAPSHGPVYLGNARIILELYEEWTSGKAEPRVVIAYVSMHHSTERMALALKELLDNRRVQTRIYDMMKTEVGEIVMDLLGSSTFIMASPVYLGGLHPAAANLCFLVNGFRPPVKFTTMIGSYGWECKPFDQYQAMVHGLGAEFLGPVLVEGSMDEEGRKLLEGLADMIVEKQKGL